MSAHTAIGKMLGLIDDEARENLLGRSSDPKVAAILKFGRAIVEKRGWVNDLEVKEARDAGLTDAAITEIVATVATTIFRNYFNHVAETDIDFPHVTLGREAAA